MKKYLKRIIITHYKLHKLGFFFLIIAISCASNPKNKTVAVNQEDTERLKNDFHKIEGEYDNNFYSNSTFDKVINWRKKQSDTTNYSSVHIKVLNDRLIQFTLTNKLNKTKIIKTEYEFNKNGFVTLKNRDFYFIGLPFILGGFETHNIQLLGITESNRLILSETITEEGALFICLPCDYIQKNHIYYTSIRM